MEYRVWAQITAAGFDSYYPVRKWRQRNKWGTGERWGPVFSSYVFVRFHPLWGLIPGYRGVRKIQMNNDKLSLESDYVIESIRKRQQAGEFDEKPMAKKRPRWMKSFEEYKKTLELLDSDQAA